MMVLLFLYFRLEFASGQMKTDPTRIFLSVMDDGFAFDLINELAKAFLRAEDRTAQVVAESVWINFIRQLLLSVALLKYLWFWLFQVFYRINCFVGLCCICPSRDDSNLQDRGGRKERVDRCKTLETVFLRSPGNTFAADSIEVGK